MLDFLKKAAKNPAVRKVALAVVSAVLGALGYGQL